MTTLAELADAVDALDTTGSGTGSGTAPAGRGALGDLAVWLAAVQAQEHPRPPRRVRVVRVGFAPDSTPPAAGHDSAGDVRNVAVPSGDMAAAIELGSAIADDEIERGADLFVLVVARPGVAAEVVTAVLTNAEPVKVLPRGTALDPVEWMRRAELVRDGRRAAMSQRDSIEGLLAVVGDPGLAAATAFLLRAAGRRTGVILDGFAAVAAASATYGLQTRTARWLRVADTSGSPGEELALGRLGQRALLGLGTGLEDGTAGLLAATVVRFAAEAAGPGAA